MSTWPRDYRVSIAIFVAAALALGWAEARMSKVAAQEVAPVKKDVETLQTRDRWNKAPSAGAVSGWACSSGGTPGTWLPLAPVDIDPMMVNRISVRPSPADATEVLVGQNAAGTVHLDFSTTGTPRLELPNGTQFVGYVVIAAFALFAGSYIALGVWDLVLFCRGQLAKASASRVIKEFSQAQPVWLLVLGLIIGVLIGHFWWP